MRRNILGNEIKLCDSCCTRELYSFRKNFTFPKKHHKYTYILLLAQYVSRQLKNIRAGRKIRMEKNLANLYKSS